MVRDIVKDRVFLSQPSRDCTFPCRDLYDDLKDTLLFHKNRSLGIAANMIVIQKRALAFFDGENVKVMFNPLLVSVSGEYETKEGCLSLEGERKTKRYDEIEVLYFDWRGRERMSSFFSLEAEVIQHEIDHMNGILI